MDHELPDALFAVPDGDAGTGLVVALSGGLDSSVLLHRLAAQPAIRARGLRALHVHHGLHADADAWADHCGAVCAALGVSLDVRRVEVARDSGLGLEAAARAARREAFTESLAAGEVLVLAHHQDDQAETFLLRALRASGPEGLAAMRPWRRFAGGWMWRPLLDQPRAVLEAWAREHDLAWIEDPSNLDPVHDRGFLRRELMPLLRQRWPGADAAFGRSAALCAGAAEFLAEGDAGGLDALLVADGAGTGLPIHALRALPRARLARLLRAWTAREGLAPLPGSGIDAIAGLLDAREDGDATYRWADACVRAWGGRLHALPLAALEPLPAGWQRDWDGSVPLPLPLPGGGSLALEGATAFTAPLRVHARQGGERLRLPGRAHHHALKQLLQEAGVPPWQRARMPLLSSTDGELLAAGDRLLSATLHDWLQARGARLRWRDLA